jgi:hypothetical protein
MGLNPSNRLDKDLKGFPTLGDAPFPEGCKNEAVAELRAAGFPRGSETLTMREKQVYKEGSDPDKMARCGIHMPGMAKPDDIEWASLYSVKAELYGWKFSRAWYYWVCRSDWGSEYDIPETVAEELNKEFRREIRVTGYAGGTDVRGPVDSYHVDTPRGLAKLIEILKERKEAIREEERKKYGG